MKAGKKETVRAVILAGIIFFVGLISCANLFHFNYKMNADIGSDVVLAELIWKSRQIVPDSWYVANEARIICTPNLAAIFFGITHNMILSTGLACTVMTVLIMCSIFCFSKMASWTLTEVMFMIFLGLAIPSSTNILELLYLFASYYAVHVVIFFITLGVYVTNLYAVPEKHRGGVILCCMLLAFLLGLQGVRGLLVLYGPLVGTEMIRRLYLCYCAKRTDKRDNGITLWVLLLAVCSFAGTLFPISVGQGFSRNLRKGFPKLCTVVLPDMARAMGFYNVNFPGKVCLCILLLLAVVLLVDIFRRMFQRKNISGDEWGYLVLCFSPVVSGLMVAFTTVESTERYYFLLVYVLAAAVILGIRRWKNHVMIKVSVGAVIVLAIINFYVVYIPILKSPEPPLSEEYEVCKYLEENEYYQAYATFENANSMTAISNGKVRVFAVASVERMDVCKWMTSTHWYVPNVPFEASTAYIVTETEKGDFEEFYRQHQGKLQFDRQIGKFLIYISDYNFSCLE